MDGLKNMVDNAMGDDTKNCVQCGKWIEAGNTGTVCGACTQSMLGMGGDSWPKVPGSLDHDPGFQPLSSYEAVTPMTVASVTVNGHNTVMTASQSLDLWAADIRDSMTPSEVAMLVRLLTPPAPFKQSNDLSDEFWHCIKNDRKISAIKELRAASTLSLKASKDIVDAIMNKPKDQDKDESKDKDDSEESDKDESEDKDQPQDDTGDEPEESEPDDDGDQEDRPYGDEFDPDDYEDAMADQGEDGPGGDQEVSELEAEVTDQAPKGDPATAEALAALAAKAADNGKNYGEDEIKAALATLGIQF